MCVRVRAGAGARVHASARVGDRVSVNEDNTRERKRGQRGAGRNTLVHELTKGRLRAQWYLECLVERVDDVEDVLPPWRRR